MNDGWHTMNDGGQTMNDEQQPDAIIGRLRRVRTLESQLVDRLEELRSG
jgi:hypothetical protein